MNHHSEDFNKGTTVCGYEVKRVSILEEIEAKYIELEHIATGARHVHILNNDKENTFSVALKTVPSDSTGVAHILEHTALCGSEKFPVRDPFFSMVKRSLNSFMNAFTASDWTMYPFSTQNRKDFYNLMDVYIDAVFFPKLDELSFKQEGHRMEFNDDSSGLAYKGVVYNEMKGAMSSANQVMARSILNALYPSTTYRFNSGGDPVNIPDLTYEQFRAFHERYYHPSNAFFYTYGDIPLKDTLAFISERLADRFERIDPMTSVPSQERWKKPEKVKYYYPLGKNEDPLKKCQVCVAWLMADIKEPFEVLLLVCLEHILLGNSASPLYKALIDSGLGSALCDGTGYDSDNRDTLFVCGLKDVEESSAEEIRSIIFNTLSRLAEKGIDRRLIEAAIHRIEFSLKEVTNNPFPYGIKLLLSFCGSWFHGGDPLRILEFDKQFKRLRIELDKGRLMEDRIKKYFLDNPHNVMLILVPDQDLEQADNDRVESVLKKVMAGLSEQEFDSIRSDTKRLQALQETEEDVSCLPTLGLKDIPTDVKRISRDETCSSENVYCYIQPTSGIFYYSSVAGTKGLTDELVPYLPLFCKVFTKMGTAVHDYVEMAQKIDAYTGGIGAMPHARTGFGEEEVNLSFISFSGKCLTRNQDKMLEIVEELLCKIDFSNLTRLKNLILEYRAGLEAQVVQNGHRLAMMLAARNFSISSGLGEAWHGIHQLQTIKKMAEDLSDNNLRKISGRLENIGRALLHHDNFMVALTGEKDVVPSSVSPVEKIIANIDYGQKAGKGDFGFYAGHDMGGKGIPREGWSTSSAVSFVAKSFKTVRMEHDDSAPLAVISRLLKSMYIHKEIREKGGAYGGFTMYNREDGLFNFCSYRDPHVFSTLKVYEEAENFIKSGNYNNEDIKEAILQICSDLDKPDTPAEAARKSFYRKIISLTDEARARYKEKVLSVSREQVIKTAEKYFNNETGKYAIAVISGMEQLIAANEKLGNEKLTLFTI